MLVIRLMHIADMPSIPELLKQQETPKPVQIPERKVEEKKSTLEINTSQELLEKLQENREIVLYSYFGTNLEISEFENGKIVYFDRKGDPTFQSSLAKWLSEKTGKNWVLQRIEKSEHQQTTSEHVKEEIQADPMVADAMKLFEDAEIINISK